MDAHDIISRYSGAKGFDLYEATQIQDLFNNHGSLLGPNANYDQVSNYLKSFYDGMKGRNIRLAEAGTSLVLESLAYASNEAVTSTRVESRFTDWEVRTNVEVQMLQSLGIAPIRRQVPFDFGNTGQILLRNTMDQNASFAMTYTRTDCNPEYNYDSWRFYCMYQITVVEENRIQLYFNEFDLYLQMKEIYDFEIKTVHLVNYHFARSRVPQLFSELQFPTQLAVVVWYDQHPKDILCFPLFFSFGKIFSHILAFVLTSSWPRPGFWNKPQQVDNSFFLFSS